jgi:cellulose synthase/poly-beta-1,6-N-acetylglucosamine synthase-like glycosyltransferase
VDGDSKDDTCKIIREYQNNFSNIHLLHNPEKIVPTALNLAINNAQGEIIVRVDGHCEIEKNYIRHCVTYLQNQDISAVGGPMQTIGETFSAKAISLVMSSPLGVGGSAFRTSKNKKIYVETVPFPAYRKNTLIEMGPFDEELVRNQDDEYNYRILEKGGKILLAPEIRSVYYSRSSLKSLWRQYYQYGYWKVRVMQKHPHQMRYRQFVPPALILSLLISSLIFLFFPQGYFIYGFIPILYLLFVISAALFLTLKNKLSYFPLLFLAIPTVHVSYGLGFWAGLIKFLKR